MSNDSSVTAQTVSVAPNHAHRVVADPAVGITLPVVFVPGVMGTRLTLESPDGEVVFWDPDSTVKMADWLLMPTPRKRHALKDWRGMVWPLEDGDGHVTADESARGWDEVAWEFYGGILRALEQANLSQAYSPCSCPVYACGYDWRKSNAISARWLAQRVDSILAKHSCAKVILVTHSMGGIVSRAACALVSGFEAKVAAIVHTVQPAAGALVAYRRFHDGATDEQFAPSIILGRDWWQYTATVSGAHGPLQLLPTDHYTGPVGAPEEPASWLSMAHDGQPSPLPNPDVWGNYLRRQLPGVLRSHGALLDFTSDEWNDVIGDLRAGIVTAARFHRRLGLHQHPTTFVAYSTSHPTQTTAELHHTTPRTAAVRRRPWGVRATPGPGDATVPESSARAILPSENGQRSTNPRESVPQRLLETSGEHGKVFDQSPTIRNFVIDAIRYVARTLHTAGSATRRSS